MPRTSTATGTSADNRLRRFSQPTTRVCHGADPVTAGVSVGCTRRTLRHRVVARGGGPQAVTIVPAPASVKTSTSRLCGRRPSMT